MTTLPDRQTEPPPGWSHNLVDDHRYGSHMVSRSAPITEIEHAWTIYERETAPAVVAALDQRMREVAEWLRDLADALQLETSVATRDSAQIVEAKATASLLREIAAALASRFPQTEGSK